VSITGSQTERRITYHVSNDEYTFMKEHKIITVTDDGNKRLNVLHKLIIVLIHFREPQVIPYKHYV